MTKQTFSVVLGNQLIKNAASYGQPTLSFFHLGLFSPKAQDYIMLPNTTEISFIPDDEQNTIIIPLCSIADVNGKDHHLVACPLKTQSNGKKCTKTRVCKELIIMESYTGPKINQIIK
jgi:hypothetical protein